MGTRADFYIGRGMNAEWIGSIAYDGYPEGKTEAARVAKDEASFRNAVAVLTAADDGTTPDMGWPWPWENSGTTDYAYALEGSRVWASCFGSAWFKADEPKPDESSASTGAKMPFPDMSGKKNSAPLGDMRSGVMLFRSR